MYDNNGYIDYSVTQVMQMIGRAGRPQVLIYIVDLLKKIFKNFDFQFDKTATSVIMTKQKDRVINLILKRININ